MIEKVKVKLTPIALRSHESERMLTVLRNGFSERYDYYDRRMIDLGLMLEAGTPLAKVRELRKAIQSDWITLRRIAGRCEFPDKDVADKANSAIDRIASNLRKLNERYVTLSAKGKRLAMQGQVTLSREIAASMKKGLKVAGGARA